MRFSIIILAFIFFLSACVPSIHPLYTEGDIVFEPALEGKWFENLEETWIFTKNKKNGYKLQVVNQREKYNFVAYLVKVEDRLFLDLYPAESEIKKFHEEMGTQISTHIFLRVKQIEPTLQMGAISQKRLAGVLNDHPDVIKHVEADYRTIITAEPRDIQTFLIKHIGDNEFFNDLSNMKRKVGVELLKTSVETK